MAASKTKGAAKKPAQSAKSKAAAKAAADKAAKARKDALASGAIIEGTGDIEFHRVDRNGDVGKIQERAAKLLALIEKSKTPVTVQSLIAKNGGQFPQYLAMFQLLEAMGAVVPYRQRGGKRGEGAAQVAYLSSKFVK